MTRGDSAAGLLALRAGAGTRASASASAGTVASATVATISARTAIAARVNGILGPLGIQRQIGRHRRDKVIRLRASLIGIPTAESIAIARRIGRLDQLAIGRSLEVDLRTLASLKRDLNATTQLEKRAGIVDVVEVTLGIAGNRRVTVIVVSRRAKRTGRLCVTHLVAIHATARGVVHIVGSRTIVDSEINVRVIRLDTHERCALNATGRKHRAIGRRNQRRSKVIIKVDNRQRRTARNLATDNQLIAIQRGHAGTTRKTKIDDAFFGNARRGPCVCVRQCQHVELAVTRDHIGMLAVFGQYTAGVDDGTNRNAAEHITRRLAQHLNGTCTRRNQNIAVAHCSARPVVALISINMLPRNSAGQYINTRQMTVIVRTRSIVDINGANVEIVAIDRQLGI